MYKYVFYFAVAGLILVSCNKKEEEEPCSEPFTIDLGPDQVIQEGTSLELDAGISGMTYLWSTGEKTQKITVDTTGHYWVVVSSCSSSEEDSVYIALSYPTIKMNTGFGTVRFWLYHNTPLHRANFLDLAGQAFYDGLIFHRVVQDFVIQGGDPDGTGYGGPGYTIPAEIVPGLNHAYGAVGAARLADNVNPDKESNGSQFYMVSDQNGEPGLNGNYTVFGMVFEGLDVVYAISQVPVDANQKPITDVVMDQVNIEYFTAEELHSTYGFDIP